MITDTGKQIVAKYLIGTAPAYASYVAVGCGAKPRPEINTISGASSSGTTVTVGNTNGVWIGAKIKMVSGTGQLSDPTIVTEILSSTQFTINTSAVIALSGATISLSTPSDINTLDFEMFRVPIVSRGYVNDNGVDKIIFTAELPTEERYEISEVGIYSAGSNTTAGAFDSKTITAFPDTETWQYNDGTTLSSPTLITGSIIDGLNVITSTASAIQTNANNSGFLNVNRAQRYERCRFLNNIIMLRGNTSSINSSFNISLPKFLQLSGQSVDFSRNSPSDLLKVAFSIVNVDGDSALNPDFARIVVEFYSSSTSESAKFGGEVANSTYRFSTNRYVVISKRLDELVYTPGFSWKNVDTIKIYVGTINNYTITTKAYSSPYVTLTTSASHNLQAGDLVDISGLGAGYDGQFVIYDTPASNTFRYTPVTTPGAGAGGLSVPIEASSSKYFIALDAIRLDNVSTVNPLYGLTGYSIVQNTTAETIIKSPNTNNYVEFRMILGVA